MRALTLVFLLIGQVWIAAAGRQPTATCTALAECRQLTLDALAAAEYERAHDLAWRVVQTSPRRDHDPAALSLLARAQSLSGRGYDALVALQRLADAGVVVEDAETSDDFRRVRELSQWPALLDTMTALRAKTASSAADPANTAVAAAKPKVETAAKPPAPRVADAPAVAARPGGDTAAASTPPATSAPPAPVVPAAPVAPVVRAVPLPSSVTRPTALAYDSASARFVIAAGGRDSLHVLSESSGNATNLVRDGWSGDASVSAVAIDHRRGDLWVAGRSPEHAALHRLQLISGRLIETIPPPKDAGAVELSAIAVGPDAVYALDSAGRRVFSAAPKAAALRPFVQLRDIDPTALALGNGALYIAHLTGVVRVDLGSRAVRAVTAAKGVDASGLHSLAWHDGTLLAVQGKDAGASAVRLRLNGGGLTITSIEVLEPAGETAGALSGEMYCYVSARDGAAGVACRGLKQQ